jgi:hypothetical protein
MATYTGGDGPSQSAYLFVRSRGERAFDSDASKQIFEGLKRGRTTMMMMIEQLEDLTMAMTGAQQVTYAYVQERQPQMVGSMEITLNSSRGYMREAGRAREAVWCPECGKGFRMVSASVAAAMADVSFRTLYRWAETGEVHFSATAEGALMVCLDSLLERADALCEHPTTASLMIV